MNRRIFMSGAQIAGYIFLFSYFFIRINKKKKNVIQTKHDTDFPGRILFRKKCFDNLFEARHGEW